MNKVASLPAEGRYQVPKTLFLEMEMIGTDFPTL